MAQVGTNSACLLLDLLIYKSFVKAVKRAGAKNYLKPTLYTAQFLLEA